MTKAAHQNWSEGVSIVVPTYKRPDGIRIALNSLLGQSAGNRPVEIVVADNDPVSYTHLTLPTIYSV